MAENHFWIKLKFIMATVSSISSPATVGSYHVNGIETYADPTVMRALLQLAAGQRPSNFDASPYGDFSTDGEWGSEIMAQLPQTGPVTPADLKVAFENWPNRASPSVDQLASVMGFGPSSRNTVGELISNGVLYQAPDGAIRIDTTAALIQQGPDAISALLVSTPEEANRKMLFQSSMQTLAEPDAIRAMDNLEVLDQNAIADDGQFGTTGMQHLAGMRADDDATWDTVAPGISREDRQRYIDAAKTACAPENSALLEDYSGGDLIFDQGEFQRAVFANQLPFYESALKISTTPAVTAMENLEAARGIGVKNDGRFGMQGLMALAASAVDDPFWNNIHPPLTIAQRQSLIDAAKRMLLPENMAWLNQLLGSDGLFDQDAIQAAMQALENKARANVSRPGSRNGAPSPSPAAPATSTGASHPSAGASGFPSAAQGPSYRSDLRSPTPSPHRADDQYGNGNARPASSARAGPVAQTDRSGAVSSPIDRLGGGDMTDRVYGILAQQPHLKSTVENTPDGIRITHKKGSHLGNDGFKPQIPVTPSKKATLQYDVSFDEGFDFNKGGKMPGLGGGTANRGGTTPDGHGFSARFMFRSGGHLTAYVYDMDKAQHYGTNIDTGITFIPGHKYTIKQHIELNSGLNHDGVLQVYVTDRSVPNSKPKLCIDRHDMKFVNGDDPKNNVDVLMFHSYYGGSPADQAARNDSTTVFNHIQYQPE